MLFRNFDIQQKKQLPGLKMGSLPEVEIMDKDE